MCGIAGFVGPKNDGALRAMADAIRHRGPDGEGFHHCPANGVSLAHRRLSILDIEGGAQPMWNEDGSVCVVFNGEIYNHLDLRRDLIGAGHAFKSDHSDTEVLIHGYEEWGAELPNRLNGMFAFCIYDRPRRRLFLARDRFGKKPLYYGRFEQGFYFASELTALLRHPGVAADVDPVGLQKYLGYGFIPAPQTLYKNVRKLPGGHFLLYDLAARISTERCYWRFHMTPDERLAQEPEADLAEELRARLSAAVKRRLVADVPVGLFLSGGIDSAAVLACAAKEAGHERIKTFSIGFKERAFDESDMARAIAGRFNAAHSQEILDIDAARNVADLVLSRLDEPMADSSILPTYLLSRFARKSVTVALSGDGGDELFAGYAPFRALNAATWFRRVLPAPIRSFLRRSANLLPAGESYMSLDFKLKRALGGLAYPPAAWNPAWLAPLPPEDIAELTGRPVHWEELYSDAIDAWNGSDAQDLVGRSIEFYGRFYLQDGVLAKVDRASMAVGLEVRSPFLDNEVVDFAARLPSGLKFRAGAGKYLLKRAMTGILPDDLLRRPKRGFAVPMTRWLKSWPMPESFLPGCNPGFVRRAWEDHRVGRRDNRLFLWAWIVLTHHRPAGA